MNEKNYPLIPILKKLNTEIKENNVYYYNGVPVPRVTHIISRMLHNDGLMYWANMLGFKRRSYKATLEEAANIGTMVHEAINDFLVNNVESCEYGFLSFKIWWDELTFNHKVNLIGAEETLCCPWFGGTYDMLINIDGENWLVDFKTSNHISINYFLQLAAYRYMLWKEKGIVLRGAIILQVSKTEVHYNEYSLDFAIPEQYNFIEACTNTFFGMVYSYHNLAISEAMFNEYMKGGKK